MVMHKRAVLCLLKLVLVLIFTGLVFGDSDVQSTIHKLRSGAELAFSKGRSGDSLKLWGQVIALEPNNGDNYHKRFRVHLDQLMLSEAMADLDATLKLDRTNRNALEERSKLHSMMRRFANADQLKKSDRTEEELAVERETSISWFTKMAEEVYGYKNWQQAILYLEQALRYTNDPALLLLRSRCFIHLQEYADAVVDIEKVLRLDPHNMEALELRGRIHYLQGELGTAKDHYRRALQVDPEHHICKEMHRTIKTITDTQKKVDKASAAKDYTLAAELLIKLISIDVDHRTVVPKAHLDLARTYRHLRKYKEAKTEAELAVQSMKPASAEALKVLGQVLLDMEDYHGAKQQLTSARHAFTVQHRADAETEDELRKAEAALKPGYKHYYAILVLQRDASLEEIKSAYRRLVSEWHRDNHKDASDEAAIQLQIVKEAYEVLSDDKMKLKYDRGMDVYPKSTGEGAKKQPDDGFLYPNMFNKPGGQQFKFTPGK